MSSQDFDYQFKTASGQKLASLRINDAGDGQQPGDAASHAPETQKLIVELSDAMPAREREENLREYHQLAKVFGFDSKISGNQLEVETGGQVPEKLMLLISRDLTKDQPDPMSGLADFKAHFEAYEAKLNQKLIVAFTPVVLHHGEALRRSGTQHTSHDDHHHDPAAEKTGMGPGHGKGPQLWEI